jgi:predicted signal transduction protein with EAL and GGDEF domain
LSPPVAELQAFVDARRAGGEGFALLLADCGVVRRLDAIWGCAVGDAARDFFASRLRAEALRESDLLLDAGRDEFACALEAVDNPDVARLAADKLLRALDAPLWVGEEEIYGDPSVGIVVVRAGDADAAALLGRAKAASAAARGRPERVAVLAPESDGREAAGLQMQSRLRAAIVQESMGFVFRPQLDIRTGVLVGAEGLLEWEEGVMPVRDAIAAARPARRASEATRWAVGGVLRHCVELRQGCGVDLRVSLSLSAADLHSRELADSVLGLLKVWNLRPSRLALSITDAGVLSRRPEAAALLQALGTAGVRLGLDDPSAGLDVLAQPGAPAFVEFRLPPPLIGDLATSAPRQAIARALIVVAHELRMEVLADGVGDAETAACLKDLGCDILQGEHIGPPRDEQSFIAAHQQ